MTTFPSFLVWLIAYFGFTPAYIEEGSSVETSMLSLDGEIPHREAISWKQRLCHFRSIDVGIIESSDIRMYHGLLGTLQYFRKGLSHIYHNSVCFAALCHAFFVCLFWKLMSGAEPLNLASSNLDPYVIATLENLCGGEFTNLFYQYTWNNILYVAGALMYIVILVRTPPSTFYRWVWPFMGIFFAICITPLIFDVPYALQVILAAIVGVFPWYLYRYDEYLCTATVDGEFVGVLQALIGYIRYITPAIPGLFLAYDLVSLVFICGYLVLFLSVLYSVYVSFAHGAALRAISHNEVDAFHPKVIITDTVKQLVEPGGAQGKIQ